MDDATVASWVLLAIRASAGSQDAPLTSVIAAADAINHAVLRHDELELAVQILEGSGLVVAAGTVLRTTEKGTSLLALTDRENAADSWTVLSTQLRDEGAGTRSRWQIAPAQFDALIAEYMREGQ